MPGAVRNNFIVIVEHAGCEQWLLCLVLSLSLANALSRGVDDGTLYICSRFKYSDVHVDGARTIAEASHQAGVKRLVHLSALGASDESSSRFLQSKVCVFVYPNMQWS